MDILAFLRERAPVFRCPKCRRSLADCKLRQLDHQGPKYKVEVVCRNCELAFLVVLELTSDEAPATPEARPGQKEAEPNPAQSEPISSDELLQVHQLLADHGGRLTDLLHEPPDG
ncbi:MAG: hypothetical protein ACREOL_07785 [Candidatus Dormibacteria bacterium]